MGGSLYRHFRANVYTVGVHGALGTSLWLRAGGLYRVSGFLRQVLGNLGLAMPDLVMTQPATTEQKVITSVPAENTEGWFPLTAFIFDHTMKNGLHSPNVQIQTFFTKFLMRGYRPNESVDMKFPHCQSAWSAAM